MTKPTIVTRAGKGSALTWTEGDSNLTNLRDATVTLKAGTGGTDVVSDLNGTVTLIAGSNVTLTGDNSAKTITIATSGSLNTDLNYAQAGGGTRVTIGTGASFPATVVSVSITTTGGPVLINAYGDAENSGAGYWSTLQLYRGTTSLGAVVHTEGSAGSENSPFSLNYIDNPSAGTYTYYLKVNAVAGGDINFGESTAPIINVTELKGVKGDTGATGSSGVSNTSGTTATIYPLFAGADSTGTITSTFTDASLTYDASAGLLQAYNFSANRADITGLLRLRDGSSQFATIQAPTAYSAAYTLTLPTSAGSANQVLITNGSGVLSWGAAPVASTVTLTADNTTNATNYPLFVNAATGDLSPRTDTGLTYNPSTGLLSTVGVTTTGTLTFKQPIETFFNNGNSGAATITPNAANGSVQKYTLTGNITLNAFASPVSGQSITLFLIQDATGSRTLTSTMKWSGGSKTLSTAANSIDIVTIYYDGTDYYASLAKGFA